MNRDCTIMANSLRLAPLHTSSVGNNVVYMHPPISPPPRSCAWRSHSPTSILPLPPMSCTPSRVEALSIPIPPPETSVALALQVPTLPLTTLPLSSLPIPAPLTTRFPSLLSATPCAPRTPLSVPSAFSSPVAKSRQSRRKRAGGVREVFRCPFKNCDKVSSENSNLKAHMRLHTGETPYACLRPGCGKRFRWKSSLTYHEKALHSNLRPFVCESCNKRFVERRKLQLHRDWCPKMRQQTVPNAHQPSVSPNLPLMLCRTASPIAVPAYNP